MLLTYSSLISAADSGASRLQQLVDWCKPNFEGLIVFDGVLHLYRLSHHTACNLGGQCVKDAVWQQYCPA